MMISMVFAILLTLSVCHVYVKECSDQRLTLSYQVQKIANKQNIEESLDFTDLGYG